MLPLPATATTLSVARHPFYRQAAMLRYSLFARVLVVFIIKCVLSVASHDYHLDDNVRKAIKRLAPAMAVVGSSLMTGYSLTPRAQLNINLVFVVNDLGQLAHLSIHRLAVVGIFAFGI
ncbi:hypothetical protein J6590_061710 [Homalodisca vitripennis]|nr:hypothetical protein J6590_061710 [Homalodisca vitripennis]